MAGEIINRKSKPRKGQGTECKQFDSIHFISKDKLIYNQITAQGKETQINKHLPKVILNLVPTAPPRPKQTNKERNKTHMSNQINSTTISKNNNHTKATDDTA